MDSIEKEATRVGMKVIGIMGGTLVEVVNVKKRDYRDWQDEGKAAGFKPGWAKYRYKSHYGEWPDGAWK